MPPRPKYENNKRLTYKKMEKEKITLIDAFKVFKEEKNIDRPVMMGVLKDVFLTQLTKTFGSADNFDVIVNVDKGTCEIPTPR